MWNEKRIFKRSKIKNVLKSTVAVLVLFVLIGTPILIVCTTVHVKVGYTAIIIDPISQEMWAVGDGTYAAYLFFKKAPWASVKYVYVAVDSLEMWSERNATGDYPAIPCLTRDGLSVEVDIMARWRLDPNKVLELYKNYPMLNWKMTTIASILRETVRDVIANYSAIETIEKRAEIGTILYNEFENRLTADRTLLNAVILEELDLREIALPQKFIDAIEDKLAAEQEMIAAMYRANTVIITAQANANATLIQANATAEAIALIAEKCGMNASEVAQLYILVEALKKIAETNNQVIFLMVVGENGQYIIPINELGD